VKDHWNSVFQNTLSAGLDILYPPVCAFCRQVCQPAILFPGICRSCLSKLPMRTGTSSVLNWQNLAGRQIPNQARVFSTAFYRDPIRQALLRFKFGDSPELAQALAALLIHAIRMKSIVCRAVLAVPLHSSRLRERGYNQAGLLARQIANQLNIPDWSAYLFRNRDTARQSEQENRNSRLYNLAGAFSLSQEFSQAITEKDLLEWKSRSILLVDDVLTTGATLSEAAYPLWQSGWLVTGIVVASDHR